MEGELLMLTMWIGMEGIAKRGRGRDEKGKGKGDKFMLCHYFLVLIIIIYYHHDSLVLL